MQVMDSYYSYGLGEDFTTPAAVPATLDPGTQRALLDMRQQMTQQAGAAWINKSPFRTAPDINLRLASGSSVVPGSGGGFEKLLPVAAIAMVALAVLK